MFRNVSFLLLVPSNLHSIRLESDPLGMTAVLAVVVEIILCASLIKFVSKDLKGGYFDAHNSIVQMQLSFTH